MKKKTIKNLSLNKERISKLGANMITGGKVEADSTAAFCVTRYNPCSRDIRDGCQIIVVPPPNSKYCDHTVA